MATATAVMVMAVAGVATADTVSNDLTSSANVLSVVQGGNGSVAYTVANTNSNNDDHPDSNNACNLAGTGTSITITPGGLPSDVDAPATTIEACGEDVSIAFSVGASVPTGDYSITHTITPSSGVSGTFHNLADFTLRVTSAAPANTPPTLTLPDNIGPVEGNTLGGATVSYVALASDTEDGSLTPSCLPASDSVFPVGTATVNCSVTDSGGLSANGSFTVTVVDTMPPTVTVPGNQSATFSTALGGADVSWAAPTAQDIVDGSVTPSCTHASGSLFPAGTTTVTCSATDIASNTGAASFNVVVTYASTGIRQPINADGSSVFRINSTVPVKIQLTGDSAGYGDGSFTIKLARLTGAVYGDDTEPVVSTSAHTGSTLRYDASSDQYVFNLGTKTLSAGTYRVTVELDDGSTRTATFGLRK